MSVFQVYMDHWLIDENKAKRRTYFLDKRDRIKASIIIRLFVSRFFELLKAWPRDMDEIPKMKNYGLYLAKRKAVAGLCRICKKNVRRFYLKEDEYGTYLYCRCQGCQRLFVMLEMTN